MNDLVMSMLVMAVMTTIGLRMVQTLPSNERLYPTLSLLAHMASAPIMLALTNNVFGVGDVHYYFEAGKSLARLMHSDFARWAPEVFKYSLQIENDLAYLFPEEFGGAYSTTSMVGFTGWMMFLLNNAEYASFFLMAGVAFLGKLASYRGVRIALPMIAPSRVAIAMLLVPSVVFWSSGIVKESFAVTGLGLCMLWLAKVSNKSLFRGLHLAGTGLLLVYLFKPYLLFPFALSAGTWIGLHRTRRSNLAFKPVYLIIAVVAIVSAVIGLSAVFPEFSPSRIGESAAQLQQYGAQTGGGSNYTLGNTETTTLSGQLAFAPIALITVLIRPFFFEIRNFSMLIASVEATILLVLLVQLFRHNSPLEIIATVRRTPPLAYCLVFTLVAGLAIGLATSNFGTLSRYRIPMMSYYVLIVLALTEKRTIGSLINRDHRPSSGH